MNSSANSTATIFTRLPFMTLSLQRLYWKEARQVAPLAVALLAINLLMHLLTISYDALSLHGIHRVFLMLIPCLFAIGAGSLLVSQEKEQRTIGWLSSLPIAARQILIVKVMVSMLGLAIVWIACLLIAFVFDSGAIVTRALGDVQSPLPLTIANSIFLLFLSIATAWRWQSPLAALLMIVPLAALPTFFLSALQSSSPGVRISDFLVGGLYLFLSGVFCWYGWRSGQAFLNSKTQHAVWQSLSKTLERRGSHGNLLGAQPQGLAATLLWQFSQQNRMISIAVLSTIMLSFLAYVYQLPLKDHVIIPLATWLIASWLGASVFQSDSVHQRIKFLAERGVTPQIIWWTRQILPLGIVLVATAIAAWLTQDILTIANSQQLSNPLLLLGLPVVLLAHAAAQWLGQLIRSPIVSLIVAPAVTLGAIGYMVFAIFDTGAPYWMVIVPIAIAFIATRVMTQLWMDGRTGLKYWLGHGAFLIAALAIPLMPLFVTVCTYPGMPRSVEQKFYAAYQVPKSAFELVLPTNSMPLGSTANESEGSDMAAFLSGGLEGAEVSGADEETEIEQPELGFVEQIKRNVADIEKQLAHLGGAIEWSPAVGFVSAEAMLTRALLDMDATNEGAKERYRTAMRMLADVVKRMRRSERLVDQELADRIEMWMYEQVKAKDGHEMLGESNWSAITSLLSDRAGRMAARRRAIVQSWAESLGCGARQWATCSGRNAVASPVRIGLAGGKSLPANAAFHARHGYCLSTLNPKTKMRPIDDSLS